MKERKAGHGISADYKPKAIPGSLIKFKKQGVFQELLQYLDGNPKVLGSDLRLGYLLPQILPGHRLWCYATERPERFLPVEKFEVRHSVPAKQVWLNIYLNKRDLDRVGISEGDAMSDADLAREFEIVSGLPSGDLVCFQQRTPEAYGADPLEALALIIRSVRNKIWETVKVVSPYRKHYIYCCPSTERKARLPQMLSIYLLMFFFGSITRYSPLYFEDLLEFLRIASSEFRIARGATWSWTFGARLTAEGAIAIWLSKLGEPRSMRLPETLGHPGAKGLRFS